MIMSLFLSLLLFFMFQVLSSLLSVAIVGVLLLLLTSRIIASVLIPTDECTFVSSLAN